MGIEQFSDGKMDVESFIATFQLAFPERPKDKVEKLAAEMANKDGKISMANMLILFYLFCSGKTEDNLIHIFNLFDQDGNKVITIDELLNLMSVFIEIGKARITRSTWPLLWPKCSKRETPTRTRSWTSKSLCVVCSTILSHQRFSKSKRLTLFSSSCKHKHFFITSYNIFNKKYTVLDCVVKINQITHCPNLFNLLTIFIDMKFLIKRYS